MACLSFCLKPYLGDIQPVEQTGECLGRVPSSCWSQFSSGWWWVSSSTWGPSGLCWTFPLGSLTSSPWEPKWQKSPAEGARAELIVCCRDSPACLLCKHCPLFIPAFGICLICQGISRSTRSLLLLRSDSRELQDFHKKAESVLGEQRALPWQPCAGPDLLQRENTALNPSLLGWRAEGSLLTCSFLI